MKIFTSKILLVSTLLGIFLVPSISIAANTTNNPFDTITLTNNSTDTNPSAEAIPNQSNLNTNPTSPSSPVTPSNAVIQNTPIDSFLLGKNKDINGESRLGTDNPNRYEKLSDFASRFNDNLFGGGNGSIETGEKGARNFLVTVARDAKNFFTLLAFVFIILRVLIFFFGSKGEENAKVMRNAVIYSTLGIMLMQVSYIFINTLFNKDVGAGGGATAIDFYKAILLPIINLIRVLASFAFLAMAFVAFFQMVTSGGDPKAREKGISTIIGAIIGFALIKLTEVLVTSIYGKIDCPTILLGRCQGSLLTDPNLSDTLKIFTTIINYINGFIGIITVLIIIYAGWNIMFNGEEGIKKGKSMIKWIVVGLLLLFASYILFRFFIIPKG